MLPALTLLLALVALPASASRHGQFGFGEVQVPAALERSSPVPHAPAGAAARPALPALASGYTQHYIWPLDRHLYDGLVIVNYVDHDPTSGLQDYSGGTWTYDGHTGTDNVLYDFRLMDRGTQVRAAASGVVTYLSDTSPYDRHCDFNWPDDGNWIWIAGGDGSFHEYLHLRRSSITVKLGESVQAGELLGLVGSSGYSTAPHLHFEAGAYDGAGGAYQPRDPYAGPDNPLPSLWNVQPAYEGTNRMWVADAGIYTESEVGGNVGNLSYCDVLDALPEPRVLGIGELRLCLRFQYQSRCCDTATVIVRRPDGSVYDQFDFASTNPAPLDWFYAWFYLGPYVTPADTGTWRQQMVRKDGALLLDHPFTVGATTQWGPRFWPRAGRSFRIDGTVQRDTLREFPLGPAVTYSLLGAPSFVTLQDSILSVGATSNQPARSAFFQVVMTDAAAHRDTAFYHVVDQGKPLDALAGVPPATPRTPALALAAAPQPFRDAVSLAFALPDGGEATLAVHDLAGRRVRVLARGRLGAGEHLARWDGRDDAGRAVPAGVYWVRLVTGAGAVDRAVVRVP